MGAPAGGDPRTDAETGGVLRALVEVLAGQAAAVADDIEALQDDWFIETCAEWVVPYIGELVGTRALHPLADAAGFSNRAQVADTLRFRRRKGTAAMLEDLARVSTGFSARAVEFFETLSTTQHVNHVRLQAPGTAGVRDANAMELVRGPFDTSPHTVDVRTMDDVYGWHNLPNIGLFVWPVPSYPLDRATAVAVAQPPDGRWLVDPLGADRAMAGPMVVETSIDHRAEEANVPGPLRRRPLHDELDERRAAPSAQRQGAQWFDADDPAVVVWIQDTPATELTSVPLDLLFVGDLSRLVAPDRRGGAPRPGARSHRRVADPCRQPGRGVVALRLQRRRRRRAVSAPGRQPARGVADRLPDRRQRHRRTRGQHRGGDVRRGGRRLERLPGREVGAASGGSW